MPLPETVTIGPMAYTVTDDKALYAQSVVDFNEQTWGRVQYHLARILLEPEQSAPHKRVALLHECLHACWHVTDPLDPNSAEEFAIRTLAGPLLDMLRRNPDLVTYLLAED